MKYLLLLVCVVLYWKAPGSQYLSAEGDVIAPNPPAYQALMARELWDEAYALATAALQNIPSEEVNQQATILKDMGIIQYSMSRYVEGTGHFRAAVRLLEDFPAADLNLLAFCHNELAFGMDMSGFVNMAIVHFEKAFEIWWNNYWDDHKHLSSVFINLNDAFNQYGDRDKSNYYLGLFGEYVQRVTETGLLEGRDLLFLEFEYAYTRLVFHTCYLLEEEALADFEMLKLMEKRMSLADRKAYNGHFLSAHENIGIMFKSLKKFEKAQTFYEVMHAYPLNDFFSMKASANKSIVFYHSQEWAKALYFCNKALVYFENNTFGSSELVLKIVKTELLFRLGQGEAAERLLEEIFSIWVEKPVTLETLTQISITDLKGKTNQGYRDVLLKAANILFLKWENTRNHGYMEKSFHLYWLAAETFEQFYLKQVYNPQLDSYHKSITEGLMKTMAESPVLQVKHLHAALTLLAKNTSRQFLKEFLSKNEQNLTGNFQLIQQRNILQLELDYLKERDTTEIFKAKQNELYLISRQLDEANGQRTGFDLERFALKQVLDKLAKGDLLVQWMLTEKALFALTYFQGQVQLINLGPSGPVLESVERLAAALRDPKADFRESASTLYAQLFAHLDLSAAKRLVLIPGGELGYLPFEVLTDANGQMLLQRFPISYAYSLPIFAFSTTASPSAPKNFLAAYAPSYGSGTLPYLKNNLIETAAIGQSLSGHAYLGEKASKKAFVENFTNYKVHHLALHALQDDFNYENSALVFAGEEKLHFHELYNYHIPAELMVLSACNTGVGSLAPGIGLMGLGRALTYAGVQASVYSLWSVPDKETAELMVYFYSNLKKGLTKDEALRQAKLEFLEKNPFKNHPYFWAGFVMNGKVQPIVNPFNRLGVAAVVLAVFAFLAFFFRSGKSQ
jgi:CHAT domain-containing protein